MSPPVVPLRTSMAANGVLVFGCACAAFLCVLRAHDRIGHQLYADGVAIQTAAMVVYQHLRRWYRGAAFFIRYETAVLPSYLGIGMLVALSHLPIQGLPRPASAFALGLAALYVLLIGLHIRALLEASSARRP